jgi:hypothetical protein
MQEYYYLCRKLKSSSRSRFTSQFLRADACGTTSCFLIGVAFSERAGHHFVHWQVALPVAASAILQEVNYYNCHVVGTYTVILSHLVKSRWAYFIQ